MAGDGRPVPFAPVSPVGHKLRLKKDRCTMQRTITVVSELYGSSPKDELGRGILKEQILSDRLVDLAYAGESNINKTILFDAWERLPISIQRAFIDYALPGLVDAEEKAAMIAAERSALLASANLIDTQCEATA